ncbi:MAG: diguanylate cyclase [Phycisphaerales bacterium]|jgi:diguanylate cyclase (GGDEF)-like protein|nr:diguanylate cyclase [Phycisphaerales bacterium]
MNQIRVLLAEDDFDHRRMLLSAIAGAGAAVCVTPVSCREEFLAAVRHGRFDCIVLDFNIPPATAPELLQELSTLVKEIPPVVVISSSEDQAVVIEAIREGVADFVPKYDAVQGTMLWERVSKVVNAARAQMTERRRINRRLRSLEKEARHDPLTGLNNRGWAERVLARSGDRGDRRSQTALVMVDLDHFKRVNDTFGHAAGDEVLRRAAGVMRAHSAETDIVCRWGGEEFLVVRQSCSLIDAWIWADNLRREIEAQVEIPSNEWRQTASIGVDVLPTSEVSVDAVGRADRAMYLAKDSGRDRVCTWDMAWAMEMAHECGIDPSGTTRERVLAFIAKMRATLGPTQLDHIGPHGERVRAITLPVAERLGLGAEERRTLSLAAEFHDLGKVGVPEALLALPRGFSEGERRFMNEHARFGAELLAACGAEDDAVTAVEHHHQRFDRCADRSVPSLASLLCVADAVDAMVNSRPYAQSRTPAQVLAELQRERGRQFHPGVVDMLGFVEGAQKIAA